MNATHKDSVVEDKEDSVSSPSDEWADFAEEESDQDRNKVSAQKAKPPTDEGDKEDWEV